MAPHPTATDLPALLAKLCDAGVEFIIVGGAACVIQGAPITTNDLGIVHRRTPENVERLLELLLQLDATMRYEFANRGLRPTAEFRSSHERPKTDSEVTIKGGSVHWNVQVRRGGRTCAVN